LRHGKDIEQKILLGTDSDETLSSNSDTDIDTNMDVDTDSGHDEDSATAGHTNGALGMLVGSILSLEVHTRGSSCEQELYTFYHLFPVFPGSDPTVGGRDY